MTNKIILVSNSVVNRFFLILKDIQGFISFLFFIDKFLMVFLLNICRVQGAVGLTTFDRKKVWAVRDVLRPKIVYVVLKNLIIKNYYRILYNLIINALNKITILVNVID